jgi:ubiquinone/menaquinone biosynthesis C-methylase UbiE
MDTEVDERLRAINEYYNRLAQDYDRDRFDNAYGRFLHRQETALLNRLLPSGGQVLSIGCGTGRLMEKATHGADISPEMVAIATQKFPAKVFTVCSATQMPYENGFFDGAFCLHVLMHLPVATIGDLLAEAGRTVKPGGWLVVDFPNKQRRKLFGKRPPGWHGNTGLGLADMAGLAKGHGWRAGRYYGVLLLPIHRFPAWLRGMLWRLDTWLCRGPLKRFASYYMLLLQKQG